MIIRALRRKKRISIKLPRIDQSPRRKISGYDSRFSNLRQTALTVAMIIVNYSHVNHYFTVCFHSDSKWKGGRYAPSNYLLKARSHIISKWSWLPVIAGTLTAWPCSALHSASANAIMLLFCISFSPLGMLNTAGAGFLVVGGPCHLLINCSSKVCW